ncbi:MAG: hypothetical protein CME28_03995 [Gemmatimonadetes bacterium]|nr:hypothetical protein [Gemmatimonadota bacterium]
MPAKNTMARKRIQCALTCVILFLSCYSHAVEVESVDVYLFYNESGSFSENILEAEEFILWNTVVGGGSAEEPSDRFLIRVQLKGSKNTYATDPVALAVKAKESGEVLYTETYAGFQFMEAGIAYRASMVAGHNCQPLVIEVGSVRRALPFRCGE